MKSKDGDKWNKSALLAAYPLAIILVLQNLNSHRGVVVKHYITS